MATTHDEARVVVDDQLRRHAAEAREAAEEGGHRVGRGLRVRVDHGVGGREGQRGDQAVGATARALAHGHVDAGIPPVGLQKLARRVARAPEVTGGLELRAHRRQVVLQDGDAASVAGALQMLADHRRRHACIFAEHLEHGTLERVEQRCGRFALVGWGLCQGQQPVDRRAAHLQPPGDRSLGEAFAIEPAGLRPIMHLIHPFLPCAP